MKNQFYRFYALLILAASVLVWSFNAAFSLIASPQDYKIDVSWILNTPENETLIQKVPDTSIQIPADLVTLLDTGQTIAIENHESTFYYKRGDKGYLYRIGPVPQEDASDNFEIYLIMIFYGALAILILLLVRPIFKDLQNLQQSAIEFGQTQTAFNNYLSKRSAIYPLSRAFSKMSKQLSELFSLHKDLSRTIAHEIRTPLARMRFLIEKASDKVTPEIKDRMHDDLDSIEDLLSEYLTFSRQEALGQFPTQTIQSIDILFDKLSTQFDHYKPNVNLSFTGYGSKVNYEENSLRYAIQNLINNSFRYSKDSIRVTYKCDSKYHFISVEDDGPGFSSKQNITSAFIRNSEESGQSTGYGLGLYIVRKVMIRHEGKVIIDESQDLKGARVSLVWPKD